MDRRAFIKKAMLMTGSGVIYASCKVNGKTISGTIVGQNAGLGHLVRDKKLSQATSFIDKEVVIIGGGISGLSAARALTKNNIRNVLMIEMDSHLGGNSKWGENDYSQYPFGAHYLPIPNNHQKEITDFLQSCNIITAYSNELPDYNEAYLCHAPEDRLYINNFWQEGVVPAYGIAEADKQTIERFLKEMESYKWQKGNDDKYFFDIPISSSSEDSKYQYLDGLTLAEWLAENSYKSEHLNHYLNYAMKDDFGVDIAQISAWVGIHYFAARKGKANNAESSDILTWPGGNGFLAQQLLKQTNAEIQHSSMVYHIEERGNEVLLSYYNGETNEVKGIKAKYVIAAIPAFIFKRLMGNHQPSKIPYSTWMIGNLVVKNDLIERKGAWMSWDNVIYNSESLGYINNNHQLLNRVNNHLNLTYYLPFTNGDHTTRQKVLDTTYEAWVKTIIDDLKMVHPNIEECLVKVDIHLWGHAMVQPKTGWIFGDYRKSLNENNSNRIFTAHTDYAGISIFEEAFYQGWYAAEKVMNNGK